MPATLWVRIVILVVLALRDSGGSCSTCCVEIYFTVFNGHCFRLPRGTMLVRYDNDGGSIGSCVHIRAAWSSSYSLSVSTAAMVSQMRVVSSLSVAVLLDFAWHVS